MIPMTTRDTYDIKKNEIQEIFERMMEAAKWHAQLQVQFDQELQKQDD